LSITSHINLAMIVWQTLSGARNVLIAQKFTNILIVIVAGEPTALLPQFEDTLVSVSQTVFGLLFWRFKHLYDTARVCSWSLDMYL